MAEAAIQHRTMLILIPMLVFVLLPFAAPLAMHLGWYRVGDLIYRLYSPFCHQLPQRSWFLFGEKLTYSLAEIHRVESATSPWGLRSFVGNAAMGWKVAWSDRMISFYGLTPLFGLLYVLLHRTGKPIKPLSWTVLIALLLPLALDGGTHALNDLLSGISSTDGFRDANQWLAWLTFNAFPGFYAGDHIGTFNWWARLLSGALAAWGVAFTVFPHLEQIFERETANFSRRQ